MFTSFLSQISGVVYALLIWVGIMLTISGIVLAWREFKNATNGGSFIPKENGGLYKKWAEDFGGDYDDYKKWYKQNNSYNSSYSRKSYKRQW